MAMASRVETASLKSVPAMDASGAIHDALRRFFDQLNPATRPRDLSAETPLLASGLLDSLAILQLTMFLGEEFGLEIGDEDFTLENFETIGTLVSFIQNKQQG